ncbi:MAG: ATP12 family protein [Alcanivorax sp.]
MKRFYTLVSHERTQDGYEIHLDGKTIKTQTGAVLSAPTAAVADLAVKEWAQQKDQIIPDTMPITQILNTKIDQVAIKREAMYKEVIRYLNTDFLCYQTAEPKALAMAQEDVWGRWISWADTFYEVSLLKTSGLAVLQQPEEYHQKIKSFIDTIGDDEFTLLQILVPLTGSVILSMALLNKAASSEEVLQACFLEEDFKNDLYDAEKYGVDPHIEARKKNALRDLIACEQYLGAL